MVWQRLIGNPDPFRVDDSLRAQMALGMQFTRYYQWMVGCRHGDRPSILIPTDPTGIRDLFRLREVPEGRQRRAALKHWVSAHWRKKRDDEEAKIFVRQHLRGAETFDWLGLQVYDLSIPRRIRPFRKSPLDDAPYHLLFLRRPIRVAF